MPKTIQVKISDSIHRDLDLIICLFFFGLLPIDSINGFLLHSNIHLPISVAQAYKSLLLLLLLFKSCFRPKFFIYTGIFFFILIIPSVFQIYFRGSISHLLPDVIKISRYLIIVLSFFFFTNYIQNNKGLSFLFTIVYFSYFFVVFTILLKYLNLGYPMYRHGDIGSRGFFYAGNEISVLLMVFSAIIGKRLWTQGRQKAYVAIGIISLFTALTISSKTSILGILLVLILIPIRRPDLEKVNFKRLFKYFIALLISVPLLVFVSWNFIKNSKVIIRLSHFWAKQDFLTFIYSNRNNFLKEYFEIYKNKYTFVEKFLGVGQYRYEELSDLDIAEIDIADIFFAQGVLGVALFLFLIFFILYQSHHFSKFKKYKYANFVFLMSVLLFVISCFTGHTFNSGMAGPFIGLLFALMYIKVNMKSKY